MDNQPLSDDEAFHNYFFYFVKALGVMSLDAAAQCEAMGNLNVAWEIQHEVLDSGTTLQNWSGTYLSAAQKDGIARLVATVNGLPQTALVSNEEAMTHPSWANLRIGASRLIELLELPIKSNREFFQRTSEQQ